MTVVPILLYHSVSDAPPPWIAPYCIRPDTFAQHLELVARAGATPVTVRELAAGGRLPPRPVAITFDDGLADVAAEAHPLLAAAQLPWTLYVTTGFVGLGEPCRRPDGRWLDRAGIVALHGAGVEIGAHSHSHPHLDTLPAAAARLEIVRPKELLEEALGAAVSTFAYPHGYRSRSLQRLVREAGYDSACAVGNAIAAPGDDRFSLARLTVRADTTLTQLDAWLHGTGAPRARRHDRPRTHAWRVYRRTRAALAGRPGSDW